MNFWASTRRAKTAMTRPKASWRTRWSCKLWRYRNWKRLLKFIRIISKRAKDLTIILLRKTQLWGNRIRFSGMSWNQRKRGSFLLRETTTPIPLATNGKPSAINPSWKSTEMNDHRLRRTTITWKTRSKSLRIFEKSSKRRKQRGKTRKDIMMRNLKKNKLSTKTPFQNTNKLSKIMRPQ